MRKAIFIDRDGVINKDPGGWTEHGYVTRWEDFIFLPGSTEALKMLCSAGYDIIVISNQAGISKGYYTEARLNEINSSMLREIEKNKARIKKVYYCMHQESDNCDCRKPKTGLFKKAMKDLGLRDIKGACFIGDGKMDIEAASLLGLKGILVLSGKTLMEDVSTWEIKPDRIFSNLLEAANYVQGGLI